MSYAIKIIPHSEANGILFSVIIIVISQTSQGISLNFSHPLESFKINIIEGALLKKLLGKKLCCGGTGIFVVPVIEPKYVL